MPHDSPTPASPTLDPAVRSVIVGLMLAIFLGAIDQTIVAVSLPSISAQLKGFELVAWVAAGYLIASTVITPIYGKFLDLYGARKLLSIAIAVFLLASIACALAQTMPQLIAARILQGLGGGGLISLAQAIIPQVVSLRDRGRYQGYLSGVYAVASVAGPIVGGLLTQYLSWRWVFWINLPLGTAALVVSRRALAHLPIPGRKPRIDYLGALLLTGGLAALLIAVTRIGHGVPWQASSNLSLFIASILLLTLCYWQERRAPEPMLPLHLFRIPIMTLSCAIMFIAFFQLVALAVLMPMRFQLLGGVAADAAGAHLVPLTLAIPFGAFTAGKMMSATGRYKMLQLAGATVVPFAIVALALTHSQNSIWMSLFMAITGFFIGLQIPATLVAAQNAVPMTNIGIATASVAFFRSLGGAVGVAILSAVLLAMLREYAPALTAALSVGETMKTLSDPTLTDAATRVPMLEAAETAFRHMLYLSAAVSATSIVLAALMPEKPLQNRVPTSNEPS